MGVPGLTALVNHHGDIYSDHKLSNTKVVVDGHNLLHLMYFKAGLDENHGGDYASYEALIKSFVKTLEDCRVKPYVLLDGAFNHSDEKMETLKRKLEILVQKAQEASQSGTSRSIRPMMAKLVFIQTLARLDVPLAQCFGEADREIAALAREWNVPVLSDDTDFYIFDLPAGVLPFSHFQWEAVAKGTGGSQAYIECKKYESSDFCNKFQIEKRLLPAFAVLAGNKNAMENIKEMNNQNANWYNSDMSLKNLLDWLRRFKTPSEAFMNASGEKEMDNLMREYEIPTSSMKNVFCNIEDPSFPGTEELPVWMQWELTRAKLPKDVLDVLQQKRKGLSIVVEEGSLPSAHETSRPLRQAMYSLLLDHNATVHERDRVGQKLQDIPVSATKTWAAEELTLISLRQAEDSQRLRVLQEALCLNDDTWASVRRLEDRLLHLPLAVTCYWFQQAKPKPHQYVLRALLLLLSLKEGPQTRRVLRGEMTPLTGRPDAAVVHALNQWQSCLKDSIHLNQLLGRPLPEPQVAWLYEGTLVHQMVHETVNQVVHMNKGLYQQLLAIVSPSDTLLSPLDDLASSMQQTHPMEGEEGPPYEGAEGTTEQEADPHPLLRLKKRFVTKKRSNRRSNLGGIRKKGLRVQDLV